MVCACPAPHPRDGPSPAFCDVAVHDRAAVAVLMCFPAAMPDRGPCWLGTDGAAASSKNQRSDRAIDHLQTGVPSPDAVCQVASAPSYQGPMQSAALLEHVHSGEAAPLLLRFHGSSLMLPLGLPHLLTMTAAFDSVNCEPAALALVWQRKCT